MPSVKGEVYQALAKPPTIDDIVNAMTSKTLIAAPNVAAALEFVRKERIEQFNFGPLSLNTIREAQREAIEFIHHGYFQLPYPVCMYRCSMAYDNATVGYTILLVDRETVKDKDGSYGVAAVAMIHSNESMLAMHSLNMMRTRDMSGEIGVEIQIPKSDMDFWNSQLHNIGRGLNEEDAEQLTEGSLLAIGLTMILGTKGVLKERQPYAHKPNAKRVASGRPPLPYITRVATALYNSAVAPGEPGTHASPRPHRRRAHLRHYPASNKHAAYVRPIAAMLVNWDGTPIEARETYEVK